MNKDAHFWGTGVDYSRLFWNNWVLNVSMAYDQEIAKGESSGKSVVNTITPSLAFGYVFSAKVAAGIGVGKGLFDDGNENGSFKFNKDAGWTIGLIGVYTFFQNDRHGFDISGGIEQGIGSPDLDLTIELGYGYSF